jgi:hypothetical protein
MVATIMPSSSNNQFVAGASHLLPTGYHIEPSGSFYWSPRTKTIHTNPQRLETPQGKMALLHEMGHALLDHQAYRSDSGLLQLEAAAWHKAEELAQALNIKLDMAYVQDCLDTYREWLYARSSCPSCHTSGLQTARDTYECTNCQRSWRVSASRFCRVYRMENRHKKTLPQSETEAVFA